MKEAQATAIAAAQQMPPDDQVGQSMACVGSEAPGSDVALASHPTPAHSASSPSPQHNQHQQIPVHPKHIVQPVLPDPSQTIVPGEAANTHVRERLKPAPTSFENVDHFHYAETSALTHMIADMLQRLTAHNDQIPLSSSTLTRFHSRAPPGISIVDYLRRIVKYASVERVCLLILLVYIDRVCERNRSFTISSLTVHRFIITGVTVACKALCDSFLQNSMYAKVGGISTKELNVLEIEFLTLIGWDLAATAERLQDYYRNLVRQHPGFCMVSHGQVAALRTGPAAGGGEVSVAASAVKEAPAHGSGKDWTGTSAFVEAAEESEAVAMMGQQQQQQQQLEQEDVYSETRYTHGDGEGRHPGGGDVPMIV
ncbi:cyclin-domain-containing protein [Chytriomyces sp. MP71]|nr:cyclin-domain-containing protein [Chytriomyces sp. MP71]